MAKNGSKNTRDYDGEKSETLYLCGLVSSLKGMVKRTHRGHLRWSFENVFPAFSKKVVSHTLQRS